MSENTVATEDRRSRRRQPQQRGNPSLPTEDPLPRQSLLIRTTGSASGGERWRNDRRTTNKYAVIAFGALVVFWAVCFVLLAVRGGGKLRFGENREAAGTTTVAALSSSMVGVHDIAEKYRSAIEHHQRGKLIAEMQQKQQQTVERARDNISGNRNLRKPLPRKPVSKPHLVSRKPNNVVATADVRGNLGPASVVVQAKPGTDWIHDRWQAASDMHGSNIPGAHWIQLEFKDVGGGVVADKIVLDWETAYADKYVLEASLEPFGNGNEHDSVGNGKQQQQRTVWTLFDGRNPGHARDMKSVSESGQSPGVEEKRPLHVVHEIRLSAATDEAVRAVRRRPFRYLRLHILKSKTGWGVSLWQFDVYGFRSDELLTSR